MKRILPLWYSVFILFVCAGLSACSGSDKDSGDMLVGPCPPGSRAYPFISYYIPVSIETPSLENGQLYIIGSREKFDELFGQYEGREEIDFGRYLLLFVKGQASNGIKELLEDFREDEGHYFVALDFDYYDTCEAPLWNSAILVSGVEEVERIYLYIDNSGRVDGYGIRL